MRIFVTGATGFIGSAVVNELIEAGHQVVGLARSDKAAESLTAVGASVHFGALDDLDSLHKGAAEADGVIHLGFKTDFADFSDAVAADLRAVETFGAALEGSNKPFVFTTGTLVVAWSNPEPILGTEDIPVDSNVPRGAAENAAISLADRGVRSSVVRLAPTVHGPGDHGFISMLIDIAREKGFSAYVGDGYNRWPAVHRLDASRLYRLAAESASAGSRLHAVGEEGIQFCDIAGAIGRNLNLPVVSISPEEAEAHFGFLGPFTFTDNPMSNTLTRERLGWRPVHPALIPDIEQGHYFNN
ncbi:nucleoside-diphosphate-sugar epimerase [Paenibacillus cellulosilyticus]|uniref:Nucleoside-diphosphate-sugar epimerase n=1 Tax=Paenibacillus cellulosilyticus TaxID=375489 RepID=A0A2V2YWR4_9BACL|nr:SDR family oxidoreductase [Paenibacillus cellulosilyticus]PWW06187.1 nucleoside-diphosphate-sugar epimerase [Paenibacillus cellulosilyticus]QKS43048.1 SDR family oxidoreductase [Paenibacillus cellulosilyticus]